MTIYIISEIENGFDMNDMKILGYVASLEVAETIKKSHEDAVAFNKNINDKVVRFLQKRDQDMPIPDHRNYNMPDDRDMAINDHNSWNADRDAAVISFLKDIGLSSNDVHESVLFGIYEGSEYNITPVFDITPAPLN